MNFMAHDKVEFTPHQRKGIFDAVWMPALAKITFTSVRS
jgi:hypothetical protein